MTGGFQDGDGGRYTEGKDLEWKVNLAKSSKGVPSDSLARNKKHIKQNWINSWACRGPSFCPVAMFHFHPLLSDMFVRMSLCHKHFSDGRRPLAVWFDRWSKCLGTSNTEAFAWNCRTGSSRRRPYVTQGPLRCF